MLHWRASSLLIRVCGDRRYATCTRLQNRDSSQSEGMAYVLTLHPTFTQGFILGQVSILLLLALILRYLFLDSSTEPIASPSPPLAHLANGTRESIIKLEPLGDKPLLDREDSVDTPPVALPDGKESMEWFNLIIHEVCSFGFITYFDTDTYHRYSIHTVPSFATMSRV